MEQVLVRKLGGWDSKGPPENRDYHRASSRGLRILTNEAFTISAGKSFAVSLNLADVCIVRSGVKC